MAQCRLKYSALLYTNKKKVKKRKTEKAKEHLILEQIM